MLVVFGISILGAKYIRALSPPTVTTDQVGYFATQPVTISGAGFPANESVSIHITHANGSLPLGNDPTGVSADATGAFTATWSIAPYDLGDNSFVAAATSASGVSAQASFNRIAVVQTDKHSYATGETVAITGAGFYPSEVVTLQVVGIPNTNPNTAGNRPFFTSSDGSGNITASWYVSANQQPGTISLTAAGGTSGLHAAPVTFTKTDTRSLTPALSTNITLNTSTPASLFAPCGIGFTKSPIYPYSSGNPLTNVAFAESVDLTGYGVGTSGNVFYVDYNDEHALLLGVSQISKKTSGGTTVYETSTISNLLTSNYSATTHAGSATPPLVGVTDQYANDPSTRPLRPSLFLTDVTAGDSQTGDWQFGGTPVAPTAVYGTWKGATALVDTTKTPNTITDTLASDPTANNEAGLPHAYVNTSGKNLEGYSTEIQWDVTKLTDASGNPITLIPGHTYRLEVMVHDGDQNQTGGDAGEACQQYVVPSPVLTVKKSSTTTLVTAAGQVVPYSYLVTNTGNVTVNNIVVTDPNTDTTPSAVVLSCPATTLAVGAHMTCTAQHTVTSTDMSSGSDLTNIVTVKSDAPTVTDTLHIPIVALVISKTGALTKTYATGTFPQAGDTITYNFTITNTGSRTLTAPFSVKDHLQTVVAGGISYGPDAPFPCGSGSVAPNGSTSCTALYTLTQADLNAGTVHNCALATTTYSDTTITSADSCTDVAVPQGPALTLVKTANTSTYSKVGDILTYTYTATNTGNVSLTPLYSIMDNKIDPEVTAGVPGAGTSCNQTPNPLLPGASFTCVGTYVVTAADLSNGSVTNTGQAFASFKTPTTTTTIPSNQYPATVNAAKPTLSLMKKMLSEFNNQTDPTLPDDPGTFNLLAGTTITSGDSTGNSLTVTGVTNLGPFGPTTALPNAGLANGDLNCAQTSNTQTPHQQFIPGPCQTGNSGPRTLDYNTSISVGETMVTGPKFLAGSSLSGLNIASYIATIDCSNNGTEITGFPQTFNGSPTSFASPTAVFASLPNALVGGDNVVCTFANAKKAYMPISKTINGNPQTAGGNTPEWLFNQYYTAKDTNTDQGGSDSTVDGTCHSPFDNSVVTCGAPVGFAYGSFLTSAQVPPQFEPRGTPGSFTLCEMGLAVANPQFDSSKPAGPGNPQFIGSGIPSGDTVSVTLNGVTQTLSTIALPEDPTKNAACLTFTVASDTGELFFAFNNQTQPTITTTATNAAIGGTVSDTATLSNTLPSPAPAATGTITFMAYGPSATANCTTTAAFTSSSVNVNGSGNYSSGNFTPLTAGNYWWVASYSGDANNGPATGACGATGETSVVAQAQPAISTSATSAALGGAVMDSAMLSGGVNLVQGPGAGTITFTAYGPSATVSCTTVAYTTSATVTTNTTYGQVSFTPTTGGVYYWIASYSGDANNKAVSGACGDPGETSVATAPPSITKSFGAPLINLNGITSLTLTISNPNAGPLFGISITDTLPLGLVVSTSSLVNGCGGTAAATAGSSTVRATVSLTGGKLLGGGSCTITVNVTGTTAGAKVNTTGTVCSTNGGCGNTGTATVTVVGPCVLGYPYASANPRTSLAFNENSALVTGWLQSGTTAIALYTDEHAMELGARKVNLTSYPFSEFHAISTSQPYNSVVPPATVNVGSPTITDASGRPLFPAAFITDLTINGLTATSGDWQIVGGTGTKPTALYGTWKGESVSAGKTTIDADPAKNTWGGLPFTPPVAKGFGAYSSQGYGTEVGWDATKLGLTSGHAYRVQFMVHDGDQNQTGGDVGESCVNVIVP